MIFIPGVGSYPQNCTFYLNMEEVKAAELPRMEMSLTIEIKEGKRYVTSGYISVPSRISSKQINYFEKYGIRFEMNAEQEFSRLVGSNIDFPETGMDDINTWLEKKEDKVLAAAFAMFVSTWTSVEHHLTVLDELADMVENAPDTPPEEDDCN